MIDLIRLQRALHLVAEPSGDDVWMVRSADRTYLVRSDVCSCDDTRMRGVTCKHVLSVRLHALDRDVLSALRTLVPEPSRAGLPCTLSNARGGQS